MLIINTPPPPFQFKFIDCKAVSFFRFAANITSGKIMTCKSRVAVADLNVLCLFTKYRDIRDRGHMSG